MLRDAIQKISREYAQATGQSFKGHPLAEYIRGEAAKDLQDALGDNPSALIARGSPGQGNWAEVPWLAAFDPMVTTSATKGYYVVYLFHATKPEVHLSLNQGTTAVREEFGRQAPSILRDRAALMRARLSDHANRFKLYDLDLGASNTLPRDYEAGHAFGQKYLTNSLPTESDLRADLQEMCRAYVALTFRGGLDPTPEQGEDDYAPRHGAPTITEIRRFRMHRAIERRSSAVKYAKAYHGTKCQACSMAFEEVYGELGRDYIEAHHLKPIGSLEEGVPVELDVATDFSVLCANCHRMIHRLEDPSDLARLRELVQARRHGAAGGT